MSGGILTIVCVIATDLAKILSQILHFPVDKLSEHLFLLYDNKNATKMSYRILRKCPVSKIKVIYVANCKYYKKLWPAIMATTYR